MQKFLRAQAKPLKTFMMLRLDHQPPIHWSEAIESRAKLGPRALWSKRSLPFLQPH
jgi:hypothetical protein